MSTDPMEKLDMPAVDSAGGKGAVVISQKVPVVAKPVAKEVRELQADLARYREAVGVAATALESVLADGQENYVGSGMDDARNALAMLKRLG